MTNTIIVGQGMAGSVLAWELHQRGHTVRIIDDGHRTSSSRVAAGMVNPVQGQRLTLAWRIEDCLPVARQFFDEMAEQFGRVFFRPAPILRLVASEKEHDYLEKRQADERFTPYLGEFMAPSENAPLNDDHGGLFINHSGYVETNPLLDYLQTYFREHDILCDAEFDHAEFVVTENEVRWRDQTAERIIFAEGWRILENPFFREFNFQPNKGEILTLKSDQPFPTHPVNRGKWIIPQPDGSAWCGSTYGRGKTDLETTPTGRDEILHQVEATLPTHELSVTGHRAGIRCAAGDHIPRAGWHPDHPRIGVFNGFGSKGNVFIPWLAQRFADHLTSDTPLPPDCNFGLNPPRRKK
ncbi:NAD(P)/FAD-dependent oxidoreductase [Cerasicoccus arenae]|uniref:Glycine oxidase n=1 Tax=Cerasicoccus arenae TaxID=424488 RepID=A0A8J3GE03_9BACT|nr:FAD-dependent oxidoreductase [Cerasicoccus arenae]MBK1858478.1 FAD-binding oxidoreductase [Cerasicoccus arenae]GHC10407.1 glycine oxidase [Cerasicoccus arenae]